MQKRELILIMLFLIIPLAFALPASSPSYNANIFIGGSGGYSTSSSYVLDLLLGQPAVGIINSSTYLGYLGFFYGAYYGTGINQPPGKVRLKLPVDNSSGTDRTPTFEWYAASDQNQDPLTYEIQVSKDKTFSDPGQQVLFTHSISGLTHTAVSNFDVNTEFYWKVRANDSTVYGDWSNVWNHTIESLSSIELISKTLDFGNISGGRSYDTTGGTPLPFVLRNTGNIIVNVTINASNAPLETRPLNTQYFQTKTDDFEANSIDLVNSKTDWMNLTNEPIPLIKEMNWEDANDEARIDIRIDLPNNEPGGQKNSTLTLEVE